MPKPKVINAVEVLIHANMVRSYASRVRSSASFVLASGRAAKASEWASIDVFLSRGIPPSWRKRRRKPKTCAKRGQKRVPSHCLPEAYHHRCRHQAMFSCLTLRPKSALVKTGKPTPHNGRDNGGDTWKL